MCSWQPGKHACPPWQVLPGCSCEVVGLGLTGTEILQLMLVVLSPAGGAVGKGLHDETGFCLVFDFHSVSS